MQDLSVPLEIDYQEAIQNPDNCFYDTRLKTGIVELEKSRSHLPKGVPGTSAIVFKMYDKSKTQKFAIRCFLRYRKDQKDRYKKISNYLESKKLEYMVEFKFIDTGIRVNGDWWPILIMDWIDGVVLNKYISQNIQNSQKLYKLAYDFLLLLSSLRKEQIAHGDLQHGNIMVINEKIKLVDYDGMWIPDIAGYEGTELGHPNYQHPSRTIADYNSSMDNFSSWVILTSIIAVGENPQLWNEVDPDQQLLLCRKDYQDPNGSIILNKILNSKGYSGKLARLFRTFAISPALIPSPIDFEIPPFSTDDTWLKKYISFFCLSEVTRPNSTKVSNSPRVKQISKQNKDWIPDYGNY